MVADLVGAFAALSWPRKASCGGDIQRQRNITHSQPTAAAREKHAGPLGDNAGMGEAGAGKLLLKLHRKCGNVRAQKSVAHFG
jgi:hypothetical protein